MCLGGQSWLDEHDIRRSTNMDIRFLSMDAGKDQSKSDLQTVQLASVHNTFVHESRIAHFGKPGWREGSLNIQSKLLGVLAAARPQWQSEQHTAQCSGANVKRETRRRASANAQPREHRNLENIRITSAALANKEDACARAPRVFNPLSPMLTLDISCQGSSVSTCTDGRAGSTRIVATQIKHSLDKTDR